MAPDVNGERNSSGANDPVNLLFRRINEVRLPNRFNEYGILLVRLFISKSRICNELKLPSDAGIDPVNIVFPDICKVVR